MDDVLILLGETERTQDEYGVWQEKTERRQVYCKVGSVTRAEFFQAGRNGLNPEFVVTVFAGDYQGERVCVYRDKSYSIYRTYHAPGTDYMELYIERKGGTNGKHTDRQAG